MGASLKGAPNQLYLDMSCVITQMVIQTKVLPLLISSCHHQCNYPVGKCDKGTNPNKCYNCQVWQRHSTRSAVLLNKRPGSQSESTPRLRVLQSPIPPAEGRWSGQRQRFDGIASGAAVERPPKPVEPVNGRDALPQNVFGPRLFRHRFPAHGELAENRLQTKDTVPINSGFVSKNNSTTEAADENALDRMRIGKTNCANLITG